MNFILFDDNQRAGLLPLTFTRPVADIRFGILTIREKWEKYLNGKTSSLTEKYLGSKFPLEKDKENILVNGSICPNKELVSQILELRHNEALVTRDVIIAMHLSDKDLEKSKDVDIDKIKEIETSVEFKRIVNRWDIYKFNSQAISDDFKLLCSSRNSRKISPTNQVINPANVFIEEGAVVECSIINASTGPVYIGKNAEVMEGCMIRGPFALCNNAQLKMGAKIYGATTIGPYSKVGGEVNNCVIFGYSNKAHDGFLGHSVIGEWCNLGSGTEISDLKNTYETVKIWNYPQKTFIDSEEQFLGLIMGDHSKCGINTMFNTGTVVGVSSNIFGPGYPRNFIPSFSWGGVSGFKTYDVKRAFRVAEAVMKRRNLPFTDVEAGILNYIFEITHENRTM